MTNALVKVTTPQSKAIELVSPRVRKYAKSSRAKNTVRAYKASWQDFYVYCVDRGIAPLPAHPADLADYLAWCADAKMKASTIAMRISAISNVHKISKYPDPTKDEGVVELMKGIRREIGTRSNQKEPLLLSGLEKIVKLLPDNLTGVRDKAILLTHWASAFRRNELMGLNVDDLKFTQHGVTILLRKSKTDQAGVGMEKAIPYLKNESMCPVRAIQAWLKQSGITDGPLFRKIDRHGKIWKTRLWDHYAANLIKSGVAKIGLDPKKYSGHSPRAGYVTEAVEKGIPALSIAAVTGQTLQTVARYQRSAGTVARDAVKKAFGE